jgi:hypothetical protein
MEVRPLGAQDESSPGLRFWRPAPYLMVVKKTDDSGKPVIDAKIVMLPDKSRDYAVTWHAGWFGTINPDVTLEDGWNLTAFSGEVESNGAGVLDTLVGALTSAISPQDLATKPPVSLYRLEWSEKSGWTFAEPTQPPAAK